MTEIETQALIEHMGEAAGKWVDTEVVLDVARQAPLLEVEKSETKLKVKKYASAWRGMKLFLFITRPVSKRSNGKAQSLSILVRSGIPAFLTSMV